MTIRKGNFRRGPKSALPVDASENRHYAIYAPVRERALWKMAAKASGLSVNSYLRFMALTGARILLGREEVKKAMRPLEPRLSRRLGQSGLDKSELFANLCAEAEFESNLLEGEQDSSEWREYDEGSVGERDVESSPGDPNAGGDLEKIW